MLWIAVPATLFLALLQVAAVPSFSYLGVHGDLLVPWLACWAAIRGRDETLFLLPVAGLSLGLLGPEPLGASLLALLPIAGFAALDGLPLMRNRFVPALAATLCCGLLYPVLLAAASSVGGEGFDSPLDVIRVAPRVAILDLIATAIWYWPLRAAVGRRLHAGRLRRT